MTDQKIYSVTDDVTKFISYDGAHSRAKFLAKKLKKDISILEKVSNSSPWVIVGKVEYEKPEYAREIPLWLIIGILLLPFIFGWLLLRRGYTVPQRLLALAPIVILVLVVKYYGDKPTNIVQTTNTATKECYDVSHADIVGLSSAQVYMKNAWLLNKEGLDAAQIAVAACKNKFPVDNKCMERCLLSFKVEMKDFLKKNKNF